MKVLALVVLLALLSAAPAPAQSIGTTRRDSTTVTTSWPAAADTVSSRTWISLSAQNWSSTVPIKVIFDANPSNYLWLMPGCDLNEKFWCRSIRFQTPSTTAVLTYYTTH